MHKYADERSHVIWPLAMLLQAQSNYQLPALLHFKWWIWLKIHRQLKKVRSVLQACFYFIATWQLGLETKSALRCWGRRVLLIRWVFSTTSSMCSWIHHFHSKLFAKSDCFPSSLWAKQGSEGGKDAGKTRCVGGSGTAKARPKYWNSPSQRGANLFQMSFKTSISWGLFFLLGQEISSRNPDGLVLLGESHSPVGRTRN